jgi:hypothetical protein
VALDNGEICHNVDFVDNGRKLIISVGDGENRVWRAQLKQLERTYTLCTTRCSRAFPEDWGEEIALEKLPRQLRHSTLTHLERKARAKLGIHAGKLETKVEGEVRTWLKELLLNGGGYEPEESLEAAYQAKVTRQREVARPKATPMDKVMAMIDSGSKPSDKQAPPRPRGKGPVSNRAQITATPGVGGSSSVRHVGGMTMQTANPGLTPNGKGGGGE